MLLKCGHCKNPVCKDVNNSLCGQRAQIWRCETSFRSILAMISTVEHKEMIEAFQKKEKFFYSPILVNAILALMDMKPAKMLSKDFSYIRVFK
jgi:hypothetical protein